MHAMGINFVRFTAQIYNAINWQVKAKGDFWHFGGMAPLAPSIRIIMDLIKNGRSNHE